MVDKAAVGVNVVVGVKVIVNVGVIEGVNVTVGVCVVKGVRESVDVTVGDRNGVDVGSCGRDNVVMALNAILHPMQSEPIRIAPPITSVDGFKGRGGFWLIMRAYLFL